MKETAANTKFDSLIILGGGYSAHLAALALSPVLPLEAMIAPLPKQPRGDAPKGLAGQHAHSHIFLPRLEQELRRIDPTLLTAMADQGFEFVPGSYRLSADAPPECRRMFATRWQFDTAIEGVFHQRVHTHRVTGNVSGFELQAGQISEISCVSGNPIPVTPTTLVLDATGTQSPIMSSLSDRCESIVNEPGHVVYITQFFRRTDGQKQRLPDPLVDCPHDFGAVAVMLYPAADGWFSISMAIDASQKEWVLKLRQAAEFFDLCRQNPHVAKWMDAAEPVGTNRIYINPRNTWNVDVFKQSVAPANYIAVGDALTTMLPTLGANCSFAATHIRLVRDLVVEAAPHIHSSFSQAVYDEQFGFFQKAISGKQAGISFTPFKASRRNRWDKKVKSWVRRSTGLDRRRITKDLINSSSL